MIQDKYVPGTDPLRSFFPHDDVIRFGRQGSVGSDGIGCATPVEDRGDVDLARDGRS